MSWSRYGLAAACLALVGCGGGAGSRDGGAGAAGSVAGAAGGVAGTTGAGGGAPGSDGGVAGTTGAAGGAAGTHPVVTFDGGTDRDAPAVVPGVDAAVDRPTLSSLWPAGLPVMGASLAPTPAGDPVCYASGWCWSNPAPLGGHLAVASLAANDVWVVGPHGTARHFDGQTWKTVPTPTTSNLFDVWGSASNAVWATGDNLLMRWDGAKWTKINDGGRGALTGSPSGFWVAYPEGGLLRFDGSDWKTEQQGKTQDAFETPGGALYAVTNGFNGDSLIARPAGGTFEVVAPTMGAFIPLGVWATAPTDVWVVHSHNLMRWNGAKWTAAVSLPQSLYAPQMQHVRGTGPNDVWVSAIDGSMLRWNGTRIERWPTGAALLQRVSARAANDVWAAGDGGALVHFDGTGWRRQFAGAQIWQVDTLARIGADEVWAAGVDLDKVVVLRHRPTVGWQEIPTSFPKAFSAHLTGSGPDDIWVGFGTFDGPMRAHWDGASWSEARPSTGGLMWSAARDDIWHATGELLRGNGQTWTPVAVPADKAGVNWRGVTGSGKNDVWVVGVSNAGADALLQWNGAKSIIDHSAGVPGVIGVSVRGPADAFAWSSQAISRFDGKSWSVIRDAQSDVYRPDSVSARTGELWAATTDGVVESWNGTAWTPSDTFGLFYDVVLATDHDVFLGCHANAGGILRKPRAP